MVIPQGFPAETPGIVPTPLTIGALAPEYYTDPLVTPPGVGFDGWRARFALTFRNTWRVLLAFTILGVALQYAFTWLIGLSVGGPGGATGLVFGNLLTTVLGELAYAYAFTGAAYVVVKRAAGQTAGFGTGAMFGLRRAWPVWGGLVGNLALVGFGIAALAVLAQCLGPNGLILDAVLVFGWLFYSVLAGGMIPAIAVIRIDTSSVRTSWKLFNANFWAAAGRLLLVRVLDGVPVLLSAATILLARRELASGDFDAVNVSAVDLVRTIVTPLIEIPAWMILIVGTLITYAEMRARHGPLLSRDLALSMDPGRDSQPGLQLRDLSTWR